MAMKQTQTKMFDFSDVGLDFCAGSKTLFPDRFKKMLALGYNTQTVSSVSVIGNQVVLTYGVNHGYVADRVLKINASNLNGEYVIDSVTSNTVTLTIDAAPASVLGGFTTFIAPLGWQLVYEKDHIHIYKFKNIDDTDVYARFCFQSVATQRNAVAVGIGDSINQSTGVIVDTNCFDDLATCATVADATSNIKWDFTSAASSTFNTYTYSQGLSTFGAASCIGSNYHFLINCNAGSNQFGGLIFGILPQHTLNYPVLKKPILLCTIVTTPLSSSWSISGVNPKTYTGKLRVSLQPGTSSTRNAFSDDVAVSDFLSIDGFNTTTAMPMFAYEQDTGQILGAVMGLYQAAYSDTTTLDRSIASNPSIVTDIDLNNKGVRHRFNNAGSATSTSWIVAMIEEIKID